MPRVSERWKNRWEKDKWRNFYVKERRFFSPCARNGTESVVDEQLRVEEKEKNRRAVNTENYGARAIAVVTIF